MVNGGGRPLDDECKRTCKQLSMLRNQAAFDVVYENGRFESAVDCPYDVQEKETFNKRENRKKRKLVYSHDSGCLEYSDNGVPLG